MPEPLEIILRVRRHAACLGGSAAIGDAWLEACLPDLLSGPAPLSVEAGLRALYAAARRGDGPPAAPPDSSALARPFLALPVETRGLILLRQIEDLDAPAIAAILGLEESEAAAREDLAWQRLETEMERQPARVVIMEPDALIGLEIEVLVREMGHLPRRVQAVPDPAMGSAPPADLVILDLDAKPPLSPLGWLRHLGIKQPLPMVLLSARRGVARRLGELRDSVLLKPFTDASLQQAITRSLARGPVG
ncbi:MAG TPA: hypothetical protein VD970_17485 [Acetobacteraceae bacterium]|nr:hypothetical protein [Acetobacteraceae bacterium]